MLDSLPQVELLGTPSRATLSGRRVQYVSGHLARRVRWHWRSALSHPLDGCRPSGERGTLLGNITDSSGAAVPGVTVTAHRGQTNISRSDGHQRSGHATHFSSLPNGKYMVSSELQGFKKVIRQNVDRGCQHHHPRRYEARSRRGDRGASPCRPRRPCCRPIAPIPAASSSRRWSSDLPLTFNRNFQSLLVTVPGATRPHREHSAFFNSQDSLSTRSQRPVAPRQQHA